MPKINFQKIKTEDYSLLPDGQYLCRLQWAEETVTRRGDEMWRLRFEIIEGKYAGHTIFDNLVFSEAAMKRAKLICARLGLNTTGELDVTPELLRGRKCYVSVLTEEYVNSEGKNIKRNVVPYAGYEQVRGTEEKVAENTIDEDRLPF